MHIAYTYIAIHYSIIQPKSNDYPSTSNIYKFIIISMNTIILQLVLELGKMK